MLRLPFGGCGSRFLIGLDLRARLKKITENLVQYFNVGILTGRVRPLDPYQVPCEDVHPQLVAQGGLPCVLVGREGVLLCCGSLLGDAEVGSIDCHPAVIEHVVHTKSALEDNLCLRGWQRGEGEDLMLGKKTSV